MELRERAELVAKTLQDTYPDAKTELNYSNETELAVAAILSSQTTDKKVNQITETLFKKYKTWEDYANADLVQLQKDIHGVNFHMGKAERLIAAGQLIIREYGGQLPRTINQLITIPGVGRKIANVMTQEIWGITEGIVVDTHITRVSNRLGFTNTENAAKIEKDLMEIIPRNYWKSYSQAMVLHGRYVCIARKPKCAECVLNKICPSAFKIS